MRRKRYRMEREVQPRGISDSFPSSPHLLIFLFFSGATVSNPTTAQPKSSWSSALSAIASRLGFSQPAANSTATTSTTTSTVAKPTTSTVPQGFVSPQVESQREILRRAERREGLFLVSLFFSFLFFSAVSFFSFLFLACTHSLSYR
jgi:hypothetical protein